MRAYAGALVVFGVVTAVAACNAVLDIPPAQLRSDGDDDDASTSSTTSSSGNTDNCPSGTKSCDGKCVATDDPKTGCAQNSCTPCAVANGTASCSASGACSVLSCQKPFQDCDGVASNGCEANITTDAKNCGGCGNQCPGGLSCNGQQCGCTSDAACGGSDPGEVHCHTDTGVCNCGGSDCDFDVVCAADNSCDEQ